MTRVRVYRSYSEAVAEWRRLGIPEGALGRMDLATKQFFFVDQPSADRIGSLIKAVEARGGRGFICHGERALLSITPMGLETMIMVDNSAMVEELAMALKNRFDERAPIFEWSDGSLDLSRPQVMGILNVTPDSFSDGGKHLDVEAAVQRAAEMKAEGADVIDVGGESTRPGSSTVSPEEEWSRISQVIRRTVDEVGLPVSVDTRRPEVARKALQTGASIVNDVSGLDEEMVKLVRDEGAGAVIMHMRGEPSNMQADTRYADVVGDTYAFLERRVKKAVDSGVRWESLAVDPGLGFGKDLDGNLEIMSRLDEYRSMGRPVLLGASRKTFLGKIGGGATDDRLEASLAAAAVACWQGVRLFRVHDVKETVRTVKAVHAMKRDVSP
ncbi:MAG: dihydropteroate synthase [Methanomassiliicoccales archaeon]|nr:dihydropteroate synthase [Methanomassiliicoccales archaeon]